MRFFLLLTLFFSFTVRAEQTVLHAGRMIDTIKGKVLTKQSIFVEGDIIVKVESGYKTPAKAQIIDLKNHLVLPGLMDMHVHLSTEFSKRTYLEGFTKNTADHALFAATNARKTLLSGFTTVRDLGDNNKETISLKKSIAMGHMIGPRIYAAGKAIATTGGHADPTNGHRFDEMDFPGPKRGVINGPMEARAAVRQRYKEGSDVIKITATGGVLSQAKSGQNPQFMMDELKALIATAKDYGFTVAAHAHGQAGMLRAVLAGVDSIEHGTFMDRQIMRAMKQKGTYYVPTIIAGKWVEEKAKEEGFFPEMVRPKAAQIGPLIQKTFQKAYQAGVKIAFGTDSGVSAHGENWKEFVYMTEVGMPAMTAIQSATIEAAKLLKQQDQLGSIQLNKKADIIAIQGDPLKNINDMQNVQFVMKAGRVYKAVKR